MKGSLLNIYFHIIYGALTKRKVRNCVVIISACFFLVFVNTLKTSIHGYDVPKMKTVNDIPLYPYTLGNEATAPLNIYETPVVYTKTKTDALKSGRIIEKIVVNRKTVVIFEVIHERFTASANHFAHAAFLENADYLLLVCNTSVYIRKDLTATVMQHLIKHPAPNIGVVLAVDNANVEPHFVLFHRSHIDMFHMLFPNKHNYFTAIQWITDIYKPYHVTFFNIQISNKPKVLGVTYEYTKKENSNFVEIARNKIKDYIVSKMTLMVISYSLYGSNSRYIDGAVSNAELRKAYYANWTMWIYHDNTVPLTVLSNVCEMDNVICINMSGTKFINKMSWRFLIASVDFISRYVVRDIDSRLSVREKAAVTEWIESGKLFHVMRDHPSHSIYPISGGMWGGRRVAIKNMEDLILRRIRKDNYMYDMNFLNNIVWPIAKNSVYQHDSFSCEKYGGAHPFPLARIGLEHVGGVYINGELRKLDTEILQKTKPPKKCTIRGLWPEI